MHPLIPNTDVPRGRWLSVAVLLTGLCVVHAAGNDRSPPREPDGTIPLEADVTDVDLDAPLVPTVAPQAPAPVLETWPSGAGFEEMLGLRTACPCIDIGDCLTVFPATSNLFRGDIYTIDPDGNDRTLCEFQMRLDVPAGAPLCFCIYKRNPTSGLYVREVCVVSGPSAGGWDWYGSGQIDWLLTAGDTYAIGVAWDSYGIAYCRDSVDYSEPHYEEFGRIEGRFTINLSCTGLPETLQVGLLRTGAYAQQVCFAPPPGACCLPDDSCVDTLPDGFPMDWDTCVNEPYLGEFTDSGFTCADLNALGGCPWLDDNQGACCRPGACDDFTTNGPMNPLLCEHIGEVFGVLSEFHLHLTCDTEICDPRGACCAFDGACHDYRTESECFQQLDGIEWYNPFTYPNMICANAPCTTKGACCDTEGHCEELSEASCPSSGTYHDGIHCDPPDNLICDEGTGACCSLDGCADGVTEYQCRVELIGSDNTFHEGWLCSWLDPPCPELGACCTGPNCEETTYDVCTNGGVPPGRYFSGAPCDPNPCLIDGLGSCCVAHECLEPTNRPECEALEGAFHKYGDLANFADFFDCITGPNNPPVSPGCGDFDFDTDNDVDLADFATFQTSFGETTHCDPNPCPQVGACCLQPGCDELTDTECIDTNGVFAGAGVPCGWACNVGACCFSDGSPCEELIQLACLGDPRGGEFMGAFTDCTIPWVCGCQNMPDTTDCNTNGIDDQDDITAGTSGDCDSNGFPDECCPAVELVFLLDQSGSIAGETGEICDLMRAIEADLDAEGITVFSEVLSMRTLPTEARSGGEARGRAGVEEDCTICNVPMAYGSSTPGLPEILGDCGGGQGEMEDWGPGTAIVAAEKQWAPESARIVVPISDEGPRCGDPCDSNGGPGDPDHDVIVNAIAIANSNGVRVFPITGEGSSACVIQLADMLAAGTGGESFHREDVTSYDEILTPLVAAVNSRLPVCGDFGPPYGDVDLHDFAVFQQCFNQFPLPDPQCVPGDLNNDGVIDLDDFAEFVCRLTGPED